MTRASDLLALCWGKADRTVPGGYHPVLLHMLDVAAVALELMELPAHGRRTATLLALPDGTTLDPAEVGLLVALHDLGKLSPGFQRKVEERVPALREAGLPFDVLANGDHSRVGGACLGRLLEDLGLQDDVAGPAALAVTAHHGAVPSDEKLAPAERGQEPWDALRAAAVTVLAGILPLGALKDVEEVTDAWVAMLAGLTSVADWIGSDVSYFPYQPERTADGDYLAGARIQARSALDRLGWSGWEPPEAPQAFSALFPFAPHPLQSAVEAAAANAELLVVEAPTGCGKTEAALAAAEQWTAGQAGAGIFVALPTQATSNQMVERVASFLSRRFPSARVNLHLAHGGAGMNPTYQGLRARSVDGPDETEAGVVADAWFAARKRPLLAPFGVGTIDQALLAVLQCRHGLVRLYGLSGKVVIIDEVHAYDAFMSQILERLLAWLRAMRCRVVLLSATLPDPQLRALLRAWGADRNAAVNVAYPRLTAVNGSGAVRMEGLVPPPARRVALSWGPATTEPEDAARALMEQLEAGGCGAWICNTVAHAQRAAAVLEALGWPAADTTVFHARMPAAARQERERRVLALFGPTGQRPGRHIVVATQVIEQSLDLDFDTMVSELAPVDLMLQRAGRLWRHDRVRPPHIAQPRLSVLGPEAGTTGLDFGPSANVYHPHVLLRTWLTLRERQGWTAPDDVADLIAAVYEPAPSPAGEWAQLWNETATDLEHHQRAQRAASSRSLLPAPRSEGEVLDFVNGALDDDLDGGSPIGLSVRTRDIDETVRLLCLYRGDGDALRYSPTGQAVSQDLRPDGATTAALMGRALTLSSPAWVRRLRSAELPKAWGRVGALRGARVLAFDADGRAEVDGHEICLDPTLGLCLGPRPTFQLPSQPESSP